METIQNFTVQDAKAIVLVIHGSGEHIGRYKHLAEWLNNYKISMVGGDLPGLGRSKEKRGHIDDFNDYLEKVDEWLTDIKARYANLPIFLFGHSMGGLIVLRYLEEIKDKGTLKGAIITSPGISIGVDIPKWQLITAGLLKKIWPTFRLKSGIMPHQVSRSPEIVNQYDKDPLNYEKVSISWFYEFQKAIDEVWEKVDRINTLKLPMLFLQAGADQLVKPQAAREFVEKLNSDQVEYHHIPNLYHEIINEPEKEIYLQMISEWIIKKTN